MFSAIEITGKASCFGNIIPVSYTHLDVYKRQGDTYAANPELLTNQISQNFVSFLQEVQGKNYTGMEEAKNNFLYFFNERQIVTGQVANFNDRITELQQRRDALSPEQGNQIGQIKSPASGYFISGVDGYEDKFSYEEVTNLTADELKAKMEEEPVPASGAVGKISEDFDWYFACVLPADTALKLNDIKNSGRKVYLNMPFVSAEKIPATVAAINQNTKEEEAAVIFQCNYMNEDISSIRQETVQIEIKEYTGIRVSQKAIHFENIEQTLTDESGKEYTVTHENVRGVYVLHGSELEFVQIFPIFSSSSYVICEVVDSNSELSEELVTDHSLQLSDEVVVEGVDLYDGKIVK